MQYRKTNISFLKQKLSHKQAFNRDVFLRIITMGHLGESIMTNNMNKPLLELAKYYMEFLENDFKTTAKPNRHIEKENKTYDLHHFEGVKKHAEEMLFSQDSEAAIVISRDDSIYGMSPAEEKKLKNAFAAGELYEWKSQLTAISRKKPLLDSDQTAKNAHSFLKQNRIGEDGGYEAFFSENRFVDLYRYLESKYEEMKMADDKQFYLYIGSLSYQSKCYPLFYIPLEVEFVGRNRFQFDLANTIHVNKAAIDMVNSEYKKKNQAQTIVVRDRTLQRFNGSETTGMEKMQLLADEIADVFQLRRVDLFGGKQYEENKEIALSNGWSFALFEKGDELLLNDYAEMLKLIAEDGESEIANKFFLLNKEYLTGNPKTFEMQVDTAYDEQTLPDRFAFPSPIPLNKEQKQIINALNTDGCDKIVVEGPPGTGKSHTIASVAYDALINGKSVLVVSDSMEALDVVEEKITDVLEKVEEENISNPILRLGKKDSNLTHILSEANISKLKFRFIRYEKFKERNEQQIKETGNQIKQLIQTEIDLGQTLNKSLLAPLFAYEETFQKEWNDAFLESSLHPDGTEQEKEKKHKTFLESLSTLRETSKSMGSLASRLKASGLDIASMPANSEYRPFLEEEKQEIQTHKSRLALEGYLQLKEDITASKVKEISFLLSEVKEAKQPLFGYLFKGSFLKEKQHRFESLFPNARLQLKDNIEKLEKEIRFYEELISGQKGKEGRIDVFTLLSEDEADALLDDVSSFLEQAGRFENLIGHTVHPEAHGIELNDVKTYANNRLASLSEESFADLMTYIKHDFIAREASRTLSEIDINEPVRRYERQLTTKMNYILDRKLLSFLQTNRNDVSSMRQQLRKKRKLHKQQFEQLIQVFPCIIVGIRELAEIVPLEADLFDLVIIDEGSQVSIAQAFPAIIRAKKLLVLGDSKQFSNVKSSHASIERNAILFRNVKDSFMADERYDHSDVLMQRVENFNVTSSVLDFTTNISNYKTILRKHFRSYYELIGFSNKHFYNDSLEVMKIRAKPLADVIRFHRVQASDLVEDKNINREEADFIFAELENLKKKGFKGTVGIITPFKDQQKYLHAQLTKNSNYAFYDEQFRLKIMTFDSCQGQERDIIFYSMVETPQKRNLHYIFPEKDLKEDNDKRSQRLNVGFSRAKEEVRFVISKDVDAYTGEAGKAMRHFHHCLDSEQDVHDLYQRTDANSPMENRMLHYITQTPFYREHQKQLEIVPQFDMGKFIKQIDPYADVKDYKTDFLLMYHATNGKTKCVVLEYDGFEYHFTNREQVNEWNYDQFYTEEDIERQKSIEMYGYPFIRLNKFIMRENPIGFLDKYITHHLKPFAETHNSGYTEPEAVMDETKYRNCRKCGFKKPLEDFYDEKLKSKYARHCRSCKQAK